MLSKETIKHKEFKTNTLKVREWKNIYHANIN